MEDVVEIRKAEFDEFSRQKKVESRRRARDRREKDFETSEIQNGLCKSSTVHAKRVLNSKTDGRLPDEKTASRVPKRRLKAASMGKSILITEKDRKKAMEIGLSSIIGRNSLTAELYFPNMPNDAPSESQRRPGRANPAFSMEELNSLLGIEDYIATAQTSASMPEMRTSKHMNQRNALTDMVASIPSANKKEARSDRKTVEEATKAFTHKPRLAPDGKWKLRGLKTTLMYHQASTPSHF